MALPPAVLNDFFAERDAQEPALITTIVLRANLTGLLLIPLTLVVLLR